MSVKELIDKCKQRNGYPVTLRSLIPGRGKSQAALRAELKTAFHRCDDTEGVQWDSQRGVFVATT